MEFLCEMSFIEKKENLKNYISLKINYFNLILKILSGISYMSKNYSRIKNFFFFLVNDEFLLYLNTKVAFNKKKETTKDESSQTE